MVIWLLIELDIPQLSSSGIQFGSNCFHYVYSLQHSSEYQHFSSSLDATSLAIAIMMTSKYTSLDLETLIQLNPSNLTIPNNAFNRNSISALVISNVTSIRRIEIGDNSFNRVREFELNGLSELESVVIGKESFRIGDSERSDGACRIVNCPKLISIQIGYQSFRDYHLLELSTLPSLQSIDIGRDCFSYAPSFSLIGSID